MAAVITKSNAALGNSVPPFTPHAISVSLPTWRDNVDYEEGAKRVIECMVSGYPRFFIHLSILKVRSSFPSRFRLPFSLDRPACEHLRAKIWHQG